ncbi:sugar phosphate isomerase/epimerase family protein [Gymnodinialimonas hymeniacidonis]|uniref:sugar phosphate isomerase/epimerase family protein n=1 Tax=Gymnodinialimonas hymeniacidonis TaxID=3126508 RepID=UPI0034C6B0E9
MADFGIHALVWETVWTPDAIKRAMAQTAETGFGMIEVVIFDPSEARADLTAKALADNGLSGVVGMALNANADISSADPAIADAGETLISDALAATRDMGLTKLGGVTHSAMQRYLSACDSDAPKRIRDTYGRLAERARQLGVQLGVEAVNRYESNVVNTVEDAASIVREVDPAALFAHIDTYHMNIEEHDVSDAIRRNIDVIGHVHIGESHRGYLGSGSVDFAQTFRALAAANYDGPIVFEAFSPGILNADVSDALAAWTTHWSDSSSLAKNALVFMQGQHAAAEKSLVNRSVLARRTAI